MTAASPSHDPQARVLSTLNADGSRRWIKPRPSPGKWLNRRRALAYALIAIFTVIPFIKVHGRPWVLLDLPAREFTIFGARFFPTDTLLLALLLLAIFISIFLLTALFGRVWCGWACPQTVYMEFVFRPIERFFEGTPGRTNKNFVARSGFGKPLKYLTYLVISIYLAHTFLSYFVGVERLAQWMTSSPAKHPAGFLTVVIVTAGMMFDFCFFREQTCLVACPYGRFQSVLLDRRSTIVSYDRQRGEPRGKVKGKPAPAGDLSLPVVSDTARTGDCVDCGLCVATCPTGIDIRDGLQMECVHCTQCIDACDSVMTKLKRPTGLIGYSSQADREGETRAFLRPRVIAYPAILAVVLTAFAVVLSTKSSTDITVMRGPGRPFTELPDGSIANPVKVRVVNRTDAPATYTLDSQTASIISDEFPLTVPPGQAHVSAVTITAPRAAFHAGTHSAKLRIRSGEVFQREVSYLMMGPGDRASPPPAHSGPGGAP